MTLRSQAAQAPAAVPTLGFVLYDLFLRGTARAKSPIHGIETRFEELGAPSSQEPAQPAFGLQKREACRSTVYLNQSVADSESLSAAAAATHRHRLPPCTPLAMLATDDAIRFALEKRAKYIVVVHPLAGLRSGQACCAGDKA
ncbi:hypothetical protein ACU4GD_41650 [Cupriavidus basilensis]